MTRKIDMVVVVRRGGRGPAAAAAAASLISPEAARQQRVQTMAKEEGEEVETKPAEQSSDTVNTPQSTGKKRTIAVSRNGKSGSEDNAETKKQKTDIESSKDVMITNDTIQALADELGLADEEEVHPPSPAKKGAAPSQSGPSNENAAPDGKIKALSSQAGLRRTDGIRGRLEGVGGRADGVKGRGANVFAAVVAETARAEPPPQDATAVLRLEGLRRPFTEKQLRELLAETGEVTWFWINRIKSLAFAEFRTEKEADATRRALYDLQVLATPLNAAHQNNMQTSFCRSDAIRCWRLPRQG